MKSRKAFLATAFSSLTLILAGCAVQYLFINGTHVDIPDGSITPWAESTIVVPGSIKIGDINIGVDIQHPEVGDIDAWVESPHGTVVPLLLHESGENLVGTVFDDEADEPIDNGTAPYTGHFKIDSGYVGKALSDFDGEDAQGTWRINVRDTVTGNTGFLAGWSINITADN